MTIQLVCDQCGQPAETLQEIRPVGVSRADQNPWRSEYVTAQLHWECIVPFVGRRDAADKEPPF